MSETRPGWHTERVSRPDSAPPIRRGRPRDPGVEERVFDAAIKIYGEVGWTGFSFEAVARATGIGRAALYRRWTDRADLLVHTLKATSVAVADINTGSLRGDLLELVNRFLTQRTSPHALVWPQLMLDRHRYPEVREATDEHNASRVRDGRRIVRRAIQRGELPTGTSPTLVMDLVVGAVHNHVVSTPPSLRPAMEARMAAYGRQLVDAVLRGVGARID